MSDTVLHQTAAITLYINYCHKATLRLQKMQDQKLLTLYLQPFTGRDKECVTFVFDP
jgi:hypothetical protein